MASSGEFADSSAWDGTITAHDFAIAAHAFADKWLRYNRTYPPWSWCSCQLKPLLGKSKVGYLSLEQLCVPNPIKEDSNEKIHTKEAVTSLSDDGDDIDGAMLVQTHHHEAHYYDFHIVYSASYRVPVLYFRAYDSDGQPLLLDAIQRDLPAYSSNVLAESKWTFITQEEHPYLNRPWYKLHPCGTSEWLKLLFHGDNGSGKRTTSMETYLVAWFSVVGQVVGLKMPFEMLNDGGAKCN